MTAPGWRPDLRERFIDEFTLPKETQRIEAPTPYVWIIARTKTDSPPDYEAVRKIQAGLKITVLSRFGKAPMAPAVKVDPSVGVCGNYYLKRAIIAQFGLGANLPEDSFYPMNLGDADGRPLDGANRYVLHFEKGATPPVDAFWSITLYDPEGFQVPNRLNRFAVSSWMPFKYNADGSLDLYFQNDSPGKDREANWLPAPKGPFNLAMRLYAPRAEALTGKWNPPAIRRAQGLPGLLGQ